MQRAPGVRRVDQVTSSGRKNWFLMQQHFGTAFKNLKPSVSWYTTFIVNFAREMWA